MPQALCGVTAARPRRNCGTARRPQRNRRWRRVQPPASLPRWRSGARRVAGDGVYCSHRYSSVRASDCRAPMSLLPIVPDFLIAVLAAWLGASVVMRTPRHYGSRIFGLLTLLTALWTVSRVLWRLTGDQAIRRELMSAEAALGTLVPPALLHCVLAFTGGRPWRWPQRLAVYLGYGLGIVVGVANALDLDHPIAVRPPQRQFGGIPGPELGWGW